MCDAEGLKSRFPTVLKFPNYTAGELRQIAPRLEPMKRMRLGEGADETLSAACERIASAEKSSNARDLRNLIEKACRLRDEQLMKQRVVDPDDWFILTGAHFEGAMHAMAS